MSRWIVASARRRGDAGVTLVELLVAMAVGSLLLVCLASVFAADLRTTTTVRDKTETTAEVRLAADVIARRLRVATPPSSTAPAFVTMTGTEVSFYASIQDPAALGNASLRAVDPPLTLVTYRYDAGSACVTESLLGADGVQRTTCLMRTTTAGGVTFSYFAEATGTTTATAAAEVRSVGIDVRATATSGGRATSSSVTSRVTCPNTVPRAA
ncbi:prepilin-type N-terminal cleavage/methylation domain-containing protein [Pseudokineococcus sp. 5B2Z-1]|uniref:PulJ/GspJ family protein n=1 Tax=Pseudokineococcus sp. 5B2Z-1 TaxID=3132744 RepID=UPI0030B5D6A2